jgi:hypothetical protein
MILTPAGDPVSGYTTKRCTDLQALGEYPAAQFNSQAQKVAEKEAWKKGHNSITVEEEARNKKASKSKKIQYLSEKKALLVESEKITERGVLPITLGTSHSIVHSQSVLDQQETVASGSVIQAALGLIAWCTH